MCVPEYLLSPPAKWPLDLMYVWYVRYVRKNKVYIRNGSKTWVQQFVWVNPIKVFDAILAGNPCGDADLLLSFLSESAGLFQSS